MKMKTMTDSNGYAIPVNRVSRFDKVRDRGCRRIEARFRKAREMLERLVKDCLEDVAAMQAARELPLAEKGNFQTSSFDGLIKVCVDQAWHIELDDRVKAARDQMLEYARSLCAKAGEDAVALYEIVEEAFAATKTGSLSIGRVLSLCRRNISAPQWVAARKMLLDSINPQKGRAYLRCETRPDTQHDFKQIRLDITDCWPVAKEGLKV